MTEENEVVTAAEADATKEVATQAAPEVKPATETPAPKSIREAMFGDKIKKAKEPEEKKEEAPNATPEVKEGEKANAEATPEQNQEPPKKKGAKERIQELARGNKELRNQVAELTAELEQLKQIKDSDKTPKQFAREVYLEDKISEQHEQIRSELSEYMNNHSDPVQFQTNYEYYQPIFNRHDSWTVEQIMKYPEKIAMFDKLYEAITNGVFTMQEWINAPQPLKLRKIIELRNYVNNQGVTAQNTKTQETTKESTPSTTAKKVVPDSIKPVVSKGLTEPIDPNSPANRGATFKRIFESGVRK